ncbi:MAG TPA: hypothetical protein GXX51_04255 [Firmicutes bacterium]|nr:hypothetical protein [Bacillota bacterium]
MKYRGLNISVIVAAFAITLGAIMGMKYLAFKAQVEKPLNEFLRGSRVVKSYSVTESKEGFELDITLDEVDDLRATYLELRDGARAIMGDRLKTIVIKDTRTRELENVYYRVHFAIYEAIFTGSFQNMARLVDAEARIARLDRYRVRVDGDNVYLQLHKGRAYLYEIVPRGLAQPAAPAPGPVPGGGTGGAGAGPW